MSVSIRNRQRGAARRRMVAGALHLSHHIIRVRVRHVYRALQVSNHARHLLVAREIGCF